MIDPTFYETCDVLIDILKLFCEVFGGYVNCSAAQFFGDDNFCPRKSWENVVSAKRLQGDKNFLEGKPDGTHALANFEPFMIFFLPPRNVLKI